MKVSNARLKKAVQLRDAAIRILNRMGNEAIIADSERGCPLDRTIRCVC